MAGHEVVELERSLWDPTTRNDPELVSRLLHPDYLEVGSSGRTWTRHEILEPVGPFTAELGDFATAELTADVRLVTYVSVVRGLSGTDEVVERPVRRTSVWVHQDGRWLLRFHQGTPT
jgi:ribonuclease HI